MRRAGKPGKRSFTTLVGTVGTLLAPCFPFAANPQSVSPEFHLLHYRLQTLERAVHDLHLTYGDRYPDALAYQESLQRLRTRLDAATATPGLPLAAFSKDFESLQRDALLANPLLASNQLMLIKRRPATARGGGPGLDIGMPSNHECNSSLPRTGYENELCLLSPINPWGGLRTLYRPPNSGYVGEVDLHWDGDRLLFTQSDATNWKVFELRTDGSGLRAVSNLPDDVDSFDACYLPNGTLLLGTTASYQSVPCWHGLKKVSNLYLLNPASGQVRQVGFDQDHNFHATPLPNGQVLYHRWDYTGINHIYLRQLMVMNPDGTGQRAIYGSGSWYPNSLYFPRALPGEAGKLLCILSGYHGVHRMGQLVILDTAKGWHEAEGIVQRISGRGDPIKPMVKDALVNADWPKFLHPFPLNEKYFLVAAWLNTKASWGIYLADVFDNLVLVREEPGWALLEPVLLKPHPKPPVIPDQVDLSREDGLVYLHDVYAGSGLQGVPRGTVKSLRVLAYHFGYPGLAGPDRIGYGGPWEVMRILGTVPLEGDGSAFFRVPASTPIAVQPLDAEGKAVQLMRSWFTVMPGEKASCVGCHERPADTPALHVTQAARRAPRDLTPWYGPARGFDFEREVQPVLDRHCVRCHDGHDEGRSADTQSVPRTAPDLRSAAEVADYPGRRISQLGIDRLHLKMRADTEGILKYSPAYESLIPYIRRVGIEDDVSLLTPGEYHANTSPLIQMLRHGHHDVALDAESWDRLVTWIDLNAPCHGTWGEVYPIPDGAHERRMALRRQFGGPREDPEQIPQVEIRNPNEAGIPKPETPGSITAFRTAESESPSDFGFSTSDFAALPRRKYVPLGNGLTLTLVEVPAGEFLIGDPDCEPDEGPAARVAINRAFWMAACEISNEQFRQFRPEHNSGYYQKRHPAAASDSRGLTLNDDHQPAVRVSWDEAMAFCQWLSARNGLRFELPTERQWEWACRAGRTTPFSFGERDADFSRWANFADASFGKGLGKGDKQVTGGLEHLVLEGAALSDTRCNDGAVVTAKVGNYQPNAWGLQDLHGNAAEWTRTSHTARGSVENGQLDTTRGDDRKIVCGGSFFDPPARARSSSRLAYPSWQRVFNVGFRVVCEDDEALADAGQ